MTTHREEGAVIVRVSCNLCGDKSHNIATWSGPIHAKQHFRPLGWRLREVNGTQMHVCETCTRVMGGLAE